MLVLMTDMKPEPLHCRVDTRLRDSKQMMVPSILFRDPRRGLFSAASTKLEHTYILLCREFCPARDHHVNLHTTQDATLAVASRATSCVDPMWPSRALPRLPEETSDTTRTSAMIWQAGNLSCFSTRRNSARSRNTSFPNALSGFLAQ